MSVRAKFRVDRIEKTSGTANIWMYPVVSSEPDSENSRFFAATPSGQLMLGVVNEKTAEQFEIGKAYYLDLIPVGE